MNDSTTDFLTDDEQRGKNAWLKISNEIDNNRWIEELDKLKEGLE